MGNPENYYSHRNKKLSKETNRSQLGEREVITLLTVLEIQDIELSLQGKVIADLGSGDQHLKESLEVRGAIYKEIDIEQCNLETDEIPIMDESTDVVISLSLIEHLHDPHNFLSEVTRILKKGGALWMDTPDIEACGTSFWNDPTHVHPYTKKSFYTLLEMHGFTMIEISPNYRCKDKSYYRNKPLNFFRARKLMPFSGTSKLLVPEFLKGKCTGLFALAIKKV